jgi:hypothetical protein
MTRGNKDKLKHLLGSVPPNFIVDSPWLSSRQIDYRLAHWYIKSGWLRSVARGVYQRPGVASELDGGPVDWWAIVASIQCLMGYDVHIGGKTALSIQGFQHYLKFGIKEPVYLYGDGPIWLRRVTSNRKFITRSRALFRNNDIGIAESSNPQNVSEQYAVNILGSENWTIKLSFPERAIFEMLAELPNRESFELIDKLFEGLVSLRPGLLQELLEKCSSVKVKRYFMVYADRHDHSWRSYISLNNVNLGSGPRQTFKGGRIHPNHLISVPANFVDKNDGDLLDGP